MSQKAIFAGRKLERPNFERTFSTARCIFSSFCREEFSSPLLGRAFDLLHTRGEEGLSTSLAALAEQFTPEEMNHLAQVAEKPENTANSAQAIEDYIAIIRGQALLRRGGEQGDDLLLAAQRQYQQKKAYLEERP